MVAHRKGDTLEPPVRFLGEPSQVVTNATDDDPRRSIRPSAGRADYPA